MQKEMDSAGRPGPFVVLVVVWDAVEHNVAGRLGSKA